MRLLLRFMGFLFTAGTIVFLVGVAAVAGLLWHYSKDLPDYSQLENYEPPVMTRVHAADGSLLAEYARERRLYIPIQAVPKLVTNAFVAAEDKNFYEHNGIDFQGIMRAGLAFLENYGSGRRPQGASTITQQVAKNFLLNNELKFSRKIREALLAMKIERTFSKQKILELYVNEIYLGAGAYGVAAASLVYFDKSVHELTIPEAAYLAALPKGPNNYNPFRHHDEAVIRRNYVIDRMAEDHYITAEQAEEAKKDPLKVTHAAHAAAHIVSAEYFAEEVRRYIADNYTEQKLYEGGLSVRTTLDPKLQLVARKALIDGLVRFDETQGYHGAVSKLDLAAGEWGAKLADVQGLGRRRAVAAGGGAGRGRSGGPRRPAARPRSGRRRPQGARDRDGRARRREMGEVARRQERDQGEPGAGAGDVVYVEPVAGKDGQFRLRQVPEISGAIMAMDPYTGRVLAMVGGFSYDQSQFNRATQALRQPGSSFKPIVYSAALDNGYTPSSIVLDGPLEIDTGSGIWRPENYEQNYLGPSTLRTGIVHSRNLMTVRLAQDIGMPLIGEYAKRFGVYDNLPPYLSYALGAGETTLHAHGRRLWDVRQRRPQDPADPDRPHPGPLRPHHLPARPARVPRLRRREMDEPERADADRQARAGARSDDRLSDHLDHGGRRSARHRGGLRHQGVRQAHRRQDRHHQRREGRLVHRLLARSRGRRVHGLRQAAPYRRHAPPAARSRRPSSGIS